MSKPVSEILGWDFKPFSILTVSELYQVLRLRNEVFVVEQDCVYQDADNKDEQAVHLLGRQQGILLAYSRLFAPGLYFSDAAAIGRIVTAPGIRGNGVGRELMHKSIQYLNKRFPETAIALSGQQYLKSFYESLGFEPLGKGYLEDGIPHLKMVRPV